MEQHTCKALVVHCIDFRFRNALNDFMKAKFGDSYDLVSVAGGIKRLVADPAESNFLMEQISVSDRLHHPDFFVLIQHEDCGAYGGSKAFGDYSKEEDRQRLELVKARDLLQKKFPQSIETYFIKRSGEIILL